MPVQTMGLDYSWLVNLADIISRARQEPAPARAKAGAAYKGGAYREPEKTRYQLEKEERREDLLATQTREHEMALKKMDIDAKLAEAMSKERIATMGAEAGTEQAQIGAAGQVGAAQKTTMEKGYEFLDMLMKADEKTANGIIASLEAKRAERAGGVGARPVSTIETGGVTMELPGAAEEVAKDPNDPLTWLEDIGAYAPGAEAPRGKATGAQAKPEIDQFKDLVDDMLDKNPRSIIAITSGKGWDELREDMRTIGVEAGFGKDTIDSVIAMYEAMVPEFEEPPEGGGLGGFIGKALTPFGVGREELPPEAVPGAETYKGGAGAFKEGAPLVEKAPGFARTLEEFIETAITGPFHPAYKKWKSKKTGKVVKTEKKKELTEQDVVTEMRTWDKEKVMEFQRVATKAGLYKGPINGLHSNELDNVMKKYFKEHPEEWGEAE